MRSQLYSIFVCVHLMHLLYCLFVGHMKVFSNDRLNVISTRVAIVMHSFALSRIVSAVVKGLNTNELTSVMNECSSIYHLTFSRSSAYRQVNLGS